MNPSIAKYPSVLFALSLILSSCQLATLDSPQELKVFPLTIEEFNKSLHNNGKKTWRAQSFTLTGLKGFQNCRLDDSMIVSSDGTYVYDGGTLLCGAEDSQRIKEGTWKILDGGKNIVFDEGTANVYKAEVLSFESEKIILRSSYFGLAIDGTYTSN